MTEKLTRFIKANYFCWLDWEGNKIYLPRHLKSRSDILKMPGLKEYLHSSLKKALNDASIYHNRTTNGTFDGPGYSISRTSMRFGNKKTGYTISMFVSGIHVGGEGSYKFEELQKYRKSERIYHIYKN